MFSGLKNRLYNIRKAPSVVPAAPGSGVHVDNIEIKACPAIMSKIGTPFKPNDFAIKNYIAYVDRICINASTYMENLKLIERLVFIKYERWSFIF